MKHKSYLWIALSLIGTLATVRYFMPSPIHIRQVVLLFLFAGFYPWIFLRHLHKQLSAGKAGISSLIGFAWLYSSHARPLGTMNILQWFIFVMTGLLISSTCYLVIEELQYPFSPRNHPGNRLWVVLYATIPVLGWLPYFVAYYPAKMNADSFWQWAQAHRITPFNNWHPILDTWIIQLCSLIYNSPATYIVLQMIVMAAAIAYALRFLESSGMPRWLILAVDLFYALNPAVGILAITMWKDILFGALILVLSTMFAHIVRDTAWLRNNYNRILFVLICFLVAALRQNGPEAVGGTLLLLMVISKNVRWRVVRLAVLIFVMFAVLNGPVFHYFHVTPNKLNESLAIPSQQIAATYKYQGDFTPQLKSYFNRILPADRWVKDYNPHTVNTLKWDRKYNASIIVHDFPVYLENWAHLLWLNPGIFVQAYLSQTAEIWQFSSPQEMQPYLDTPTSPQNYPLNARIRAYTGARNPNTIIWKSYNTYVSTLKSYSLNQTIPNYTSFKSRIDKTIDPLRTSNKLQGLLSIANKVFNATRYNWKNYLIKGAIPLFLLMLSLAASVLRHRLSGLIVYLPALFVIVTFAMAIPATDFRYQFCFAFSVPFLLFQGKLNPPHNET